MVMPFPGARSAADAGAAVQDAGSFLSLQRVKICSKVHSPPLDGNGEHASAPAPFYRAVQQASEQAAKQRALLSISEQMRQMHFPLSNLQTKNSFQRHSGILEQ